jgi:hypothetical protein
LKGRANFELLSIRLQNGFRFLRIIYPLAHKVALPLPVSSIKDERQSGLSDEILHNNLDGLGSAYSPGDLIDYASRQWTDLTIPTSRAIKRDPSVTVLISLVIANDVYRQFTCVIHTVIPGSPTV